MFDFTPLCVNSNEKKKYESLRNKYLFLKFFQPRSFLRVSPAFLKLWKYSILPPWRRNSNLYIKYRVSFEISRNEGNFEHWPFFKKVLPGVAKSCLMVLQTLVEFLVWPSSKKKLWKKYGIFDKFASKLKRCSKLPSFTVHFEDTFTSFYKNKSQKESQNSRNQGFSYYLSWW